MESAVRVEEAWRATAGIGQSFLSEIDDQPVEDPAASIFKTGKKRQRQASESSAASDIASRTELLAEQSSNDN
jgi:hypothetical protein